MLSLSLSSLVGGGGVGVDGERGQGPLPPVYQAPVPVLNYLSSLSQYICLRLIPIFIILIKSKYIIREISYHTYRETNMKNHESMKKPDVLHTLVCVWGFEIELI